MHTAREITQVTKVKTSYELITNWLDIGYTLNLSSNAIQIMTTLLRFYNPNKKFVFPLQETIAQRTNTSLATVKRGLNELLKKQLLLKRRTNRGNVYGFTGRLFELLDSSNCTLPIAQFEPCMEHDKEHNKEQTSEAVVSFSKNFKGVERETSKKTDSTIPLVSLETSFNLKEPPQILKDKAERGEIRNLSAYWASLREAHKIDYWEKQKEADQEAEKKAKYQEWLKEQEQIKEQEAKEAEAFRNKPLNEQFSKETALSMVRLVTRGGKPIKEGSLTAQLVELYKIDISSMV